MWVLRAFRDAVIAAVLTTVRGWIALLWRPLESTRLMAELPLNLRRTWGLLRELSCTGLTVTTPPVGAPTLRTSVVGLGDLTTRVEEGAELTPALVAHHFAAVRERFEPLATTLEALRRASALAVAVLTTVCLNLETTFRAKSWPDIVVLFGRAFVVSFGWALLISFAMRLTALLIRRAVQRRLDR